MMSCDEYSSGIKITHCFTMMQIVTNAGRANTVAASEAAAPTLRRLERAAIAAATPISYHPR
jgi:HIV-1 Vpr-binding protein